MKTLFHVLLLSMALTSYGQDPVVQEIIDRVSMDTLVERLHEFSGEDSCTVYGNRELIRNRVSNQGNDLAADYIKERFEWYGLDVFDQVYSAGGRNIYAVQTGITNPDSIYIICGHYDAVANYCADDNAAAIIAILETARILSKYCFANTIIYAAWDEEEIGLRGSRHFADEAAANGDRILGVLNIDMMAYDGDNDTDYDIDLNFDNSSEAIRDGLLKVTTLYGLNLIPNIVQPGTFASDHASFWFNDYGAVLLGEAWSNDDVTPGYHSSNDRIDLLNLPYYFEMTKLATGFMAKVAIATSVDVSVTAGVNNITAALTGVQYQWIDCDAGNAILPGETEQLFTPQEDGNYAVILNPGDCADTSECVNFQIVVSEVFNQLERTAIHPNPTTALIHIDLGEVFAHSMFELLSINGASLYKMETSGQRITLDLGDFTPGIYFLEIHADGQTGVHKVVKQ